MRAIFFIIFLLYFAIATSMASQPSVEIVGKTDRLFLKDKIAHEISADLIAYIATCPIDSWNFSSTFKEVTHTWETLQEEPHLKVHYIPPVDITMDFYTEDPVHRRVKEIVQIKEALVPFRDDYDALPVIREQGKTRLFTDCSGGHSLVLLCRAKLIPYLVGKHKQYCKNVDIKQLRTRINLPSKNELERR